MKEYLSGGYIFDKNGGFLGHAILRLHAKTRRVAKKQCKRWKKNYKKNFRQMWIELLKSEAKREGKEFILKLSEIPKLGHVSYTRPMTEEEQLEYCEKREEQEEDQENKKKECE